MPADADNVLHIRTSCTQNNPKYRRRRNMKLFLAGGPFELVTMNIAVPLPKNIQGSQYILVITACYSKLTRAVPILKLTATTILTCSWITGPFHTAYRRNFWSTTKPNSKASFMQRRVHYSDINT